MCQIGDRLQDQLCAVDDATGCNWNHIMKSKADGPKKVIQMLRNLKDQGYKTKHIRLDDTAEWKKLARMCEVRRRIPEDHQV